MTNKTYDTLKILVTIVLPFLSAVVIGMGEIWGIDFLAPLGATITLIVSAGGAALAKLSKNYAEEGATDEN